MSNRLALRTSHPRLLRAQLLVQFLVLPLVLALGLSGLLATPPARAAADLTPPPLAGPSVLTRDVQLTGSRGTTRTFHAVLTRSAPTLAGYTSAAAASGRFDTFTGKYYYSTDQPIWTYTTEACLQLNLVEWTECMSFRIYYVRNHVTGQGIVIWGANYTFSGLRGARHCHSPGSKTTLARYQNIACGEHRFDPDKTRMKQWDEFEMTYTPGPSEVYAFHVNEYANGTLTGPYSGLGA